jgi:adenylyl-sulfate kinase
MKNVVFHEGRVSPQTREAVLGQKGVVVWLTGLSGSGKSTIAHALEERLLRNGHLAFVLDGDNLRFGLNSDLGFSPEDRKENVRRVGEVAALMADAGLVCVAALISPMREMRDAIRERVRTERFLEVFVDAPLAVCEARDPKGLYVKARAGAIPEFTGISAPYEPPLQPDLTLATGDQPVEENVTMLLELLERRGVLHVGAGKERPFS